ncbi:MAG: anti-sigma factor [Bacteroidales bacterium]
MSCKKNRINLVPYLRKELPENEAEIIRQHLDGCPECRSYQGFLEDVLSGIIVDKAIEPDPFLATRVLGHLQEQSVAASIQKARIRLIPAIVLSLFILAGLIGGVGIGRVLTESQSHSGYEVDITSLMISDLNEEPMEIFFLGY